MSIEEYMEAVKAHSELSNYDHQEVIKDRLVNEGVREASAIIMADQYPGFSAGEYWQAKYNIYPKFVQPEGSKDLWVDYIRAHAAAPIGDIELKGTYKEYGLLMKAWTLLHNNTDWTIEQVCEYYAKQGDLTARTLKGRLKKLAEYRLAHFGW